MTIRAVLMNKKTGGQASTQNRMHLRNLVVAERFVRRGDGGLPKLLLQISKTRVAFVKQRATRLYPFEYKQIWICLVTAFLKEAQPNKRARSATAFVSWLRLTSVDKTLAAYRLTKGTKICWQSDRILKETYTLIRKMQS